MKAKLSDHLANYLQDSKATLYLSIWQKGNERAEGLSTAQLSVNNKLQKFTKEPWSPFTKDTVTFNLLTDMQSRKVYTEPKAGKNRTTERSSFLVERKAKDVSWMTENAGQEIDSIAISEVEASEERVTSSDGYEFLCSYTWKQITEPTIYVPGTPRIFMLPPLPIQLDQDQGQYWNDQHGFRMPRCQFEPVFQALATMNPTIRFNDVDIVINRNTLQAFYDFVCSKQGTFFSVDLNVVGTTLFISRRLKNAKQMTNLGYGHSFERSFTSVDPALTDAEGHYRVIRYKFGGLNLAIRIEVDGYVNESERDDTGLVGRFDKVFDTKTSNATELIDRPHEVLGTTARNDNELVKRFQRLVETATRKDREFLEHNNALGVTSITVPNTRISFEGPTQTKIINEGNLMSHKKTLEMKSSGRKIDAIKQLWFGRTQYLCICRHKEGLVSDAEMMHIGSNEFTA
ncbi:hypothetical protein GQ44DRAFT_763574 [Phaeosphaeriaceae sp. PMI808]|nr:hypothetical protein GQ44DRAFT_763574 [Phaeosphaeriaceae sp. PMI808]